MEEWKEITLSLEKITFDENLQIRVNLSEERINEFMGIFEQLPPVKIVKEHDNCYLADGFHRYVSAKRLGEKDLRCFIKDGAYKGALEIAVKENSRGPLTMSRKDKRLAAEKMLMFFPERANTWIAEDCGMSMQTVESVRTDLEALGTIKRCEEFLRRDEKPTPRTYTKPAVSDVKAGSSISALPADTLTQEERNDLIRLTTKAMGKQYEKQAPEEVLTRDILQSVQKTIAKEDQRVVRPAEKSEVSMFVGDSTSMFAEAVSPDARRGVRVLGEGKMITLNVYEEMKTAGKLFPKAGVQLSIEEFGKFFGMCGRYLEKHIST